MRIADSRDALPDLADDPHLMLPDRRRVHARRARRHRCRRRTPRSSMRCSSAAQGLDLVGLLAGGPVYRGFANSDGQRNWHEATTFNLQWSLYHRADKAVKSRSAGLRVGSGALVAQDGRRARAPRAGQPAAEDARAGQVPRVPVARARWRRSRRCCAGADSRARALATKQGSARTTCRTGDATRPRVRIAEDIGGRRRAGIPGRRLRAPASSAADRRRRARRDRWCRRGRRANSRLDANGANGYEAPEALAMAGGDLDGARRALTALDTGTRDRQPLVPQLFRSAGMPDDGHDALRDVLGRGRQGRRAGRRAALRRHGLPDARERTSRR